MLYKVITNMGIGMMIAVDPADVEKAMKALGESGETAYILGSIEDGQKEVELC